MSTVASALRDAAQRLRPGGSDPPEVEARLLLQSALGKPRVWLYQNFGAALEPDATDRFSELVERRVGGEPLRYLLGECEFYGRSFLVDNRVLVPRPETEELLAAALSFAATRRAVGRPVENMVDVGTGSGILAVSLACELSEGRAVAVDRSADALAVADLNRRRHDTTARVSLVQSDLLAPLRLAADLIVANLPYVPTNVIPRLQPEVRREPREALDGGSDGLEVYRQFFRQAATRLHPRGALFAEIGADQGGRALALAKGWFPEHDVSLQKDLAGRDRFVVVQPSWRLPNC